MKKIKLKDLTTEQYKNMNCSGICSFCIFKDVICARHSDRCWVQHKDLYSDKFLEQEIEIEETILDAKEKEYLEFVLKPYCKDIKYIKKANCSCSKEYIFVILNTADYLPFPNFEKGKMYKGMELGKQYTPKDLGLWDK